MNPTSMSWDLGGVMSEIQLQRGEPSPTILHFSNFEPCDLRFIPSIMKLLYSLCNELWTYLEIGEFVHQFWIVMLCLCIQFGFVCEPILA
jgi:hypothetical protein